MKERYTFSDIRCDILEFRTIQHQCNDLKICDKIWFFIKWNKFVTFNSCANERNCTRCPDFLYHLWLVWIIIQIILKRHQKSNFAFFPLDSWNYSQTYSHPTKSEDFEQEQERRGEVGVCGERRGEVGGLWATTVKFLSSPWSRHHYRWKRGTGEVGQINLSFFWKHSC